MKEILHNALHGEIWFRSHSKSFCKPLTREWDEAHREDWQYNGTRIYIDENSDILVNGFINKHPDLRQCNIPIDMADYIVNDDGCIKFRGVRYYDFFMQKDLEKCIEMNNRDVFKKLYKCLNE